MCILELVDYNEAMLGGEAAKTKTGRKRRSVKKKETSDVAETSKKAEKTEVKAEAKAEAKAEESAPAAEESAEAEGTDVEEQK